MARQKMNGIKIAFGFFGKQVELLSGVPIIFLDGIAMSISRWRSLIGILPPCTPCLCNDFQGQMHSERARGLSLLTLNSENLVSRYFCGEISGEVDTPIRMISGFIKICQCLQGIN